MAQPNEVSARHHPVSDAWLMVAAVAVSGIILIVAALEEPYHIDELRQVGYYGQSWSGIALASAAQQQPPLDAWLNAAVQRVVGIGDFVQRAFSVVLAIGTMALLGSLLRRRTMSGVGAAVAVLALGSAPLLVEVWAYARPYALPCFLMLLFLWAADSWLHGGPSWHAALFISSAVLLPLSRTVEPLVFLGAVVAVLLIRGFRTDTRSGARSPALPLAAGAVALALVGLPTAWLLQRGMAGYAAEGLALQPGQLSRLFTDLPGELAGAFPWWPLMLAIVVAAMADPTTRKRLTGQWWWWCLLAVPVGFMVIFFLRARAGQPLFPRYMFSFWLPFAPMVGALADRVRLAAKHPRVPRAAAAAGGALLGIALLVPLHATVTGLASASRPDFRAAADAIETTAGTDGVVLYDHAQRLGAYRFEFWGRPRYLAGEVSLAVAQDVARGASDPPTDGPVSGVLLLDARPEVAGWSAVPIDDHLTMYVPKAELSGPHGVATAFEQLAAALPEDHGWQMALAAATLYERLDSGEEAARLVDGLQAQATDEQLERLEAAVLGTPIERHLTTS